MLVLPSTLHLGPIHSIQQLILRLHFLSLPCKLKALSSSHTCFDHPKDQVNTSDYDPRVKWMGHMAHMGENTNETTQKTYTYTGG